MRLALISLLMIPLVVGCGGKDAGTECADSTTPIYTLSISDDEPIALENGTGYRTGGRPQLASGHTDDLIFVHKGQVIRHTRDGGIEISEPEIPVQSIYLGSDDQLWTCLLDEDGSIYLGEGPDDEAPILYGQIEDSCDYDVDCSFYTNPCVMHEREDGTIKMTIGAARQQDCSFRSWIFEGSEDREFDMVLDWVDTTLLGLGWGSDDGLLYWNTATYPSTSSADLFDVESLTHEVLMDPGWTVHASGAPKLSALVAYREDGVEVFNDSNERPPSEPLSTFSGADIARVTTLDCGVVVVMQDKEAGTFTLNGGGESLVYSYDSSLGDVSLDAISASTGRVHVSFGYYDTDSGAYLYQILTFDAVSDS